MATLLLEYALASSWFMICLTIGSERIVRYAIVCMGLMSYNAAPNLGTGRSVLAFWSPDMSMSYWEIRTWEFRSLSYTPLAHRSKACGGRFPRDYQPAIAQLRSSIRKALGVLFDVVGEL